MKNEEAEGELKKPTSAATVRKGSQQSKWSGLDGPIHSRETEQGSEDAEPLGIAPECLSRAQGLSDNTRT